MRAVAVVTMARPLEIESSRDNNQPPTAVELLCSQEPEPHSGYANSERQARQDQHQRANTEDADGFDQSRVLLGHCLDDCRSGIQLFPELRYLSLQRFDPGIYRYRRNGCVLAPVFP